MEIPDLSKEPYAIAETVSPLIRRVLARNASPFSYTGTQTYIVGHGEVAVIDPGPLGDDPAHVGALLRLLGHPNSAHPEPVEGSGLRQAQPERVGVAPERILAIMCTHTHRDHSPAAAPLAAATGAPVIGCAPLVLSDDGPRADAGFDPTYAPDRVLQDHLCFALAEEKALFSGDHVMGWSTTVVSPPDGDMADYMRSLALLLDRDDAVYYAAHGAPIDKPQRLVRGMMGHRKQREGQILRLLERGVGAIPDMVREMYKGIDVRLYGAAGRSVLAHLIDLRDRGRVSAEGDSWIIAA
jgi:glyoxylase-like metal-dependent hydrolase (beta-lactamase superfamily II)